MSASSSPGQGEAEPAGAAGPPPVGLPRTVVWFGVVSLFTDAAGELIYPLMPLFLLSVLAAPLPFVGLVEGVAEATASLFKLVSGRIADFLPRKKPLVLFGYGLASAVRPLVAVAHSPWTVLAVRFADRLGKGVRSSPRDAMVAEVTHAGQRGAAYGYHRAMDNLGAVLGPLAGYLMLGYLGMPLRAVFAWAALPGALAVLALIFGVRERPRPPRVALQQAGAATQQASVATQQASVATQQASVATQQASVAMQQGDPRALARYLACLAVFTLGNSADAFLLVRAAQVLHPGQALSASLLADPEILLLWTLHNAVKAALSTLGGRLSDRYGRRRLIGAGWLLYGATYLGFAFAASEWQMWALFAIYGVYYALVEGAERALVAELAGPNRRGTAFGWFYSVVGLTSLPASLLFGLLYRSQGAAVAFSTAAALALLAVALLAGVRPRTPPGRAAA